MRPAGLLVLLALASAACSGSTVPVGDVTTHDIQQHPEASLTYPGATNVTHMFDNELDTPDQFGQGPQPASAVTNFQTTDRVDRVVAWYDQWLAPHRWLDATDQGNGDRRWVRGANEDFFLDCSYQAGAERTCIAAYTLRSAHFPARNAAAPALGDPVTEAVVRARQVGIAAMEDRVFYLSRQPIPQDGTAGGGVARSRWPQGVCCAVPVLLDDSSMGESPTLSAYHAVQLQVAEYNRPDVQGGAFGSLERGEMRNLENSGFLLENTGTAALSGDRADAYVFERGLREAVIFLIGYGPAMTAAQGIGYRVATVRIVYDVAPASCDLSRPECFDVLAGTADVVWTRA